MVTDPYILSGLSIGILSVMALVGQCVRLRALPKAGAGLAVFISGASVPPGVKVCVLALSPDMFLASADVRTYIFLGGLAVIWISIGSAIKCLREIGVEAGGRIPRTQSKE